MSSVRGVTSSRGRVLPIPNRTPPPFSLGRFGGPVTRHVSTHNSVAQHAREREKELENGQAAAAADEEKILRDRQEKDKNSEMIEKLHQMLIKAEEREQRCSQLIEQQQQEIQAFKNLHIQERKGGYGTGGGTATPHNNNNNNNLGSVPPPLLSHRAPSPMVPSHMHDDYHVHHTSPSADKPVNMSLHSPATPSTTGSRERGGQVQQEKLAVEFRPCTEIVDPRAGLRVAAEGITREYAMRNTKFASPPSTLVLSNTDGEKVGEFIQAFESYAKIQGAGAFLQHPLHYLITETLTTGKLSVSREEYEEIIYCNAGKLYTALKQTLGTHYISISERVKDQCLQHIYDTYNTTDPDDNVNVAFKAILNLNSPANTVVFAPANQEPTAEELNKLDKVNTQVKALGGDPYQVDLEPENVVPAPPTP